jgi:hypothetical protein
MQNKARKFLEQNESAVAAFASEVSLPRKDFYLVNIPRLPFTLPSRQIAISFWKRSTWCRGTLAQIALRRHQTQKVTLA